MPLPEQRSYNEEFIQKKLHREITYIETNLEKRLDPLKIMPEAKSVIALFFNYYPGKIIPEEDNFVIAKYAYGPDYHLFVKKKVNLLADWLKKEFGEIKAMPFVDSGSVMEKTWAQRCGVGWQGKNTLLINPLAGSFFFIGIILTDLEIEPDEPEKNHCGNCDKCMKACPTGALDRPFRLNISRCISYHTIESKQPIPEEFRGNFRDRIYGCDICQDACPFNRFSKPSDDPARTPDQRLLHMRKKDWIALTEQDFFELFQRTPVLRTGYQRLMENIRFVSEEHN